MSSSSLSPPPLHRTLQYIKQVLDALWIKINTKCLYVPEKQTARTYQAYWNFKYAYIIMLFVKSCGYSCGNWYDKMTVTIVFLSHFIMLYPLSAKTENSIHCSV